jgi:hypothetical protein
MAGNIGGTAGWGFDFGTPDSFWGKVADFVGGDTMIFGEVVDLTLIEALRRQCIAAVQAIYANTLQEANPGQQSTISDVEPEVVALIDSDFPDIGYDDVLDTTESAAPNGYVGITETTELVAETVEMYAEMAGQEPID